MESQMFIYQIVRDDSEVGWDEYAGFVIVAESEEKARAIAQEQEGVLRGYDWKNHEFASCNLIGQACLGIGEGVILEDYKRG